MKEETLAQQGLKDHSMGHLLIFTNGVLLIHSISRVPSRFCADTLFRILSHGRSTGKTTDIFRTLRRLDISAS